MKLDFLTILINIGVLMLLAIPGYIFRKKGMLQEKDSKPLVIMLLYITQPFLIIMSFQSKKYSPDILSGITQVLLFSFAIHIIILLLAKVVFDKLKISRDKKGVLTFASAFSNCGYIGIPVISSLFRTSAALPEMLIYVSIYIVVFNIMNWTIGIYILSGNKKYISIKNALINPTTVALVVALPLFFAKISLYDKAYELASAFDMFGNMTTPIAMTIIGIKLAEISIKELFTSASVYLSAFIKLIIAPIIMLALLKIFASGVSEIVIYVVIISSAMPTATVTVANTERFGGDSVIGVKTMLCSTLLSVITIPLICMLL